MPDGSEPLDAQLLERVREIAVFDEGQLVTVEPQGDDVPYAGKEFEGVPLRVDEAIYTDEDVVPAEEARNTDDFDRDRVSDGRYITSVRYRFESEYTTFPLPESCLILWDEYDGRVHLRPHGDRYSYIEDGDECPICKRTTVLVEGRRASRDHSQTRSCAVCGYEKDTEAN